MDLVTHCVLRVDMLMHALQHSSFVAHLSLPSLYGCELHTTVKPAARFVSKTRTLGHWYTSQTTCRGNKAQHTEPITAHSTQLNPEAPIPLATLQCRSAIRWPCTHGKHAKQEEQCRTIAAASTAVSNGHCGATHRSIALLTHCWHKDTCWQ